MLKHIGFTFQAMNNVGPVDANGKPNMTDARNIEVMQFFKTLAVEELIPPGTLGYKGPDAQRIYFDGKAAMMYEGTSVLLLKYPDVAAKSGILPVFKGPSGDLKCTTTFVNPLMVFKQTKSVDAAKAFAKYYTENNLSLWTSSSMSQFPVRKSFLADAFFQSNWIVKDIASKVIPYGRPGGVYPLKSEFPGWGAINGEAYMRLALQQVLTDKDKADLPAIAKANNDKVSAAIANAEKK